MGKILESFIAMLFFFFMFSAIYLMGVDHGSKKALDDVKRQLDNLRKEFESTINDLDDLK